MKTTWCILLTIFIGLSKDVISDSLNINKSPNIEINKYLRTQLIRATRSLEKSFNRKTRVKKNIIQSEIFFDEPALGQHSFLSQNFIFAESDDSIIYAVDENHIFKIGNISYIETIIYLQSNEIPVFMKALYWTEEITLFIIHYQEGFTRVYQSTISTNPVQKIELPNPTTAKCFKHLGLYCLFISETANGEAEARLFKWVHTHFDLEKTLNVPAASSIVTFSSKADVLILLAPNRNARKLSLVLRWTGSALLKVQTLKLQTSCEECLQYLLYEDKHYVVSEKTVLLWNGHRLVHVATRSSEMEFDVPMSVAITLYQPTPLIFVLFEHQMNIYNFKNFRLEASYYVQDTIASATIIDFDSNNSTFMYATKNANGMQLVAVAFVVESNSQDILSSRADPLMQCMSSLQNTLLKNKDFISVLEKQIPTVLRTDIPQTYTGVLRANGGARVRSGEISNGLPGEYRHLTSPGELLMSVVELQTDVKRLNDVRPHLLYKSVPNVIPNSLRVRGGISCIEANVDSASVMLATGTDGSIFLDRPTTPDSVESVLVAQSINAHNLKTAPGTIIDDLLMNVNDQVITGKYSGNTLVLGKVLPSPGKINDVPIANLVRKGSKEFVTGTKTAQALLADSVDTIMFNQWKTIDWINDINKQFSAIEQNIAVYENISTRNLRVDFVNDVKWDDFISSLYFDSEGYSNINGDVVFKSKSRIHHAHLDQMFGIPFDNLLTKTTDQVIASNITVANLHAESVEAKTINRLDFKNAVAAAGSDNVIKNAKIDHLNVLKDLKLSESSSLDKQISGTTLDELLQIYNGRVVIKGSVTIPNLHLDPNAKVRVQDTNVSLDVPKYYWTKSTDQTIAPNVFINNVVQAPQVYSDKLNTIDWQQYMLIDGEFSHSVDLILEKVHIVGNLSFDRTNRFYNPQLQELNTNAVRLTGRFNIGGEISFSGEVLVKTLDAEIIDDVALTDLISKTDSEIEFSGVKRISFLNTSSLTVTNTDIVFLNDVNIKDYLEEVLKVDESGIMPKVNIDSIEVTERSDFQFENIAGGKDGSSDLKERYLNNDGDKKVVRITGDVHFNEIIGLEVVNNISLSDYLSLVVSSKSNVQIGGHKVFEAPITITQDFRVATLAGVDLVNLYKYGLSKSKPQNISGHYKIQNLRAASVTTDFINGLSMDQLVDKSSSQIVNSPIRFDAPLIAKNLQMDSCYSESMGASLYEMPDRTWDSVYIKRDLRHPVLTKDLENLVEYAVTDLYNASITGKITFAAMTSFENIETVNYINDIDINAIVSDALLKSSTQPTHVSGSKTFVGPVSLTSAEIHGDFDAPIINGVRIKELNESLVWKDGDAIITGNKKLTQSVSINHLQVQGLVNGVSMENVVFFDDSRVLPKAVFNHLFVLESLQVRELNGVDFDEFLHQRVRLRGAPQNISAHMQFQNLHLAGPTYLSRINDLTMDEIVFTELPEDDLIIGLKLFDKGLTVEGDIEVRNLNNFELKSMYRNSIHKDKDYYIPHVVFSSSVNLSNGLYVHSYENESWLQFYAQEIPDAPYADEIEEKLNYTFANIKPYGHYMYLEQSMISIPKPISTKVETIRRGLLSLWDASVSGDSCGLPPSCPCSLQYTVDISNQRAVTIVPRNASERMLSYYDEGIGVNVFTNTISTSSSCRTSNDEYTYISWLTPIWSDYGTPTGDITVDEQRLTGYLSDAKFFRSNYNRTYLILAMYYDKETDTHDVSSLLLELETDRRSTSIIQYIPTRSAIALELFRCSHGTHLIICNAPETENVQAYVEIMKFNEDTSQFRMVRSFSTEGCGLLASAVLRKEQFIFVADKKHHILRITRYVEQMDMFHYFQSFIYDSCLRGIHVFYPEYPTKDEAFLCVTTENGNFFVYVYTYIEGWKEISSGYLKNAQDVTSFKVNSEEFLFMSSLSENMIFKIIRQSIP